MYRALVVLTVFGVAHADPLAKPKQQPMATTVPTRSVPCMPDKPGLGTVDERNVAVCWSGGCASLDLAAGTATVLVTVQPSQSLVLAGAYATVGAVCPADGDEKKCKRPGPRLDEAMFKEAKRPDRPGESAMRSATNEATTDLKAVLFGGLWSVARDREMRLVPPARVKKPAAHQSLSAMGKFVLVEWPDSIVQIVDSNGVNRGTPLAGGGTVLQLDAKRFVVISDRSSIQVIDAATAKLRAVTDAAAGADFLDAVRLTDGLALLRSTSHGFLVERYKLDGDKPVRSQLMALPSCK